MSALLLPFAKQIADGRLVSPEDVVRGLSCNCVCPACHRPVLSKQGTEKVWHFAHAHACECSGAYEISVHELAKQLIRERKLLLLPRLEVTCTAVDAFGTRLTERETIYEAKVANLDECRTDKKLNNVTADIWGKLKGREILAEVTVFHRLMPEKRERLIATGVPSVEINLSEFKTRQATRELVEEAVFVETMNRTWIFHPRTAEPPVALQERLQRRLEESTTTKKKLEARRKSEEVTWAKNKAIQSNQTVSGMCDFLPDSVPLWRAAFPRVEQWRPARKTLCIRLGLPEEAVNAVMDRVTRRSELAGFTPSILAEKWAAELNAPTAEIFRFFYEAGFILDA